MQEQFVSRASLVAYALWFLVAALLTAAWIVAIWAEPHFVIAGMLAATALGLSAVAATAHIRLFACQLSRVVRASVGVTNGRESGEIRTLR